MILLVVIGSISAGAFLTARATPVYESQATLFVGQRQFSVEQVASGIQVATLSAQLLRSYTQIIRSKSMAKRAISESALTLTPRQLQSNLQAEPILDTQVIQLTFQASDPVLAQRATNAVAEAFVSEIDTLETSDTPGAKPAVRVSIIDRADASSTPVSPNPKRNIALAIVIGLLAGSALAFLFDRFDVSVKNTEELEQMGIIVLGAVPSLETHGEDVYFERDTQGVGGEAFRKVRTAIGFAGLEHPVKTILVSSAVPEEGKTTLSLNLASAYGAAGLRTILVEADLRRPSLHRIFGMQGTRGLTTALVGVVSLPEAIVSTNTDNLSILLAGAIPPNPLELLGSDQMIHILEQLRTMFDVVIVDSPPLVPVADASALARHCDGVVVVARAGKTDKRRLADSVRIVERAGGRLLGVVVNFLRREAAPYDYAYTYYGYRSETAESVD
jgi:receptor protein-tyrosine kinase